MMRHFADRVLGGVCGGLAAAWRVDVWLVRLIFMLLALMSGGAFVIVYLLLWWMMPQQTLSSRFQRGLPLVVVAAVIGLGLLLWAGRDLGWLTTPAGEPLFFPAAALLLSVVLFLKQLRA
jgi:phage shock protein PspC (stress-responsive transcriptional regulator)